MRNGESASGHTAIKDTRVFKGYMIAHEGKEASGETFQRVSMLPATTPADEALAHVCGLPIGFGEAFTLWGIRPDGSRHEIIYRLRAHHHEAEGAD